MTRTLIVPRRTSTVWLLLFVAFISARAASAEPLPGTAPLHLARDDAGTERIAQGTHYRIDRITVPMFDGLSARGLMFSPTASLCRIACSRIVRGMRCRRRQPQSPEMGDFSRCPGCCPGRWFRLQPVLAILLVVRSASGRTVAQM